MIFQNEWKEAMKEDDAVKITYLPTEIYAEFFNSTKTGNTNYDILIKFSISISIYLAFI